MRVAPIFAQDQTDVRRGLNILDHMIQRMEEGQRIEIFDVRILIKFLRVFGERYPQTEILEIVESIEASLNPKHGAEFVRSSRRLIQMLRHPLAEEQSGSTAADLASNPMPAETHIDFVRLERKYASISRAVPMELDRRAHA